MILRVYYLRPVASFAQGDVVVQTNGGPTTLSHPIVSSHDFLVDSPEEVGKFLAQVDRAGMLFLPGTENETGMPYAVAGGAILGYRCLEKEE
jgi:hypothetical protein